MSQMSDGTAAGLIDFLDWAGERGQMNESTAGAYKAACRKVFEIEGEDWGGIAIEEVDAEDLTDRFARKMGSDYTPGSLRTYQGRLSRAVKMYRDWLDDPSGFSMPVKERSSSTRTPSSNGNDADSDGGRSGLGGQTSNEPPLEERDGLITYPFPLRSGDVAYLQLPQQLPGEEAERLSKFLASLAIDPRPQLAQGTGE